MDISKWVGGLVAAAVTGVSNAVMLVLVDNDAFNFNEGLPNLLTVCGVQTLIAVAAYLKQSPIPSHA